MWKASLAILLTAYLSPVSAQLPKLGGETLLHSVTAQSEDDPVVALDAAGNYVVAYTASADGHTNVEVRRFLRNGTFLPPVIEPVIGPGNPTQAAVQGDASIAMANDGRFVVVWEDNQARGGNDADVKFALYAADGTRVAGPTNVNATVTGVRENACVAMNRATGEFVVSFAGGASQMNVDVFMRRYSAAGVALDGGEIKVNSSGNSQTSNPYVAMAENGNFVIGWEGNPDGNLNWEAYVQRYSFNSAGAAIAQGANTQVSPAGNDVTNVSVACDEVGNFAVVWVDGLPLSSTDPKDILLRRYNSDGTAKGAQQVVKASAFSGHGISDIPRPRIAMANDQEIFITYIHDDEVFARFFDWEGAALAGEFKVNTTTSPDFGEYQAKANIALNPTGNRGAVVWAGTGATDSGGAHIQRFAMPNIAPTLTDIPDQTITELQAYTYTAVATETADNFGDQITYTLAGPTGASINAQTGQISWTPTEMQGPNTYNLTVTATDNGEPNLSSSDSFTLTVNEDNNAPTNLTLTGSNVLDTAPEGTEVGTFSVTDVDIPDSATYELVEGTGSTDNASFTIDGTVLKVSATPDFSGKTSVSIRVRATDNYGGTVEQQFTITVEKDTTSVKNWNQY